MPSQALRDDGEGKQREVFMLQLVLGGSGSGKTTLLYHRIRARAEAGQKSILLVPEQFTSSTEGRIYRELGDALSGMVESFSFTSLAEKILSVEGGAAVQTLSDAGRAVLVRRALEELQEMAAVDIRTVDRSTLVELDDVEIHEELPQAERIADYIKQIKNPYCYKSHGVVVKISFAGKCSLEESLSRCISM